MQNQRGQERLSRGLTLVEMVVALALMVIIFAALLPQFRVMRNNWDSKEGAAEVLQNGRVLIEHINRNLCQARRIIAVSEPNEANGYIEFEDNDGNNMRYEIASNYVQFGEVGNPWDLAGPVSQLQFTCYDVCDLDTPMSSITDANQIRSVKVETTVTNSAAVGQDKSFTARAYLRTNPFGGGLGKSTPLEYDTLQGMSPALAQIDSSHYLCVYAGPGDTGWAVVLTVDTETWDITEETPYEFDTTQATNPALAKIDNSHYLCTYSDKFSDGQAVVLTVDTGTWNITKETPYEFDTTQATNPALAKIDNSHYLCTYTDKFSDGQAVVLTVDTGTWNITKETPYEFDTTHATNPVLAKIDNSHYLCAYSDRFSDGQAVVLTVDTGTWNITKETPYEYDTANGETPALAQIDNTHYLCAYKGPGEDGWVVVLTVDTGNWTITKETPFEYDSSKAATPSLSAYPGGEQYLCAYEGLNSDGWAAVLTVDSATWTVSKGAALEYDSSNGVTPALAQIDDSHHLCGYEGPGKDGWAVVLGLDSGVSP